MMNENANPLSRRSFLVSTGLAATTAWLAPLANRAFAQEPSESAPLSGLVDRARKEAESAKITIETLRPGKSISVLIGSGGNIAVLHGKDGKLLVDSGFAGSRRQVTEALASISSDPVRHVVNTHWHFDHTDGNEWLRKEGAMIIAHENVRKRMSEATHIELWGHTFPPAPPDALPGLTLRSADTKDRSAGAMLYLNGTAVRLDTFQPAHTDGDTSVEFVDADVIHLGDLFWNGLYPFIDYDVGGSINGMIRAAETNLARATEKSIIIPGHGPISNKSKLGEFRDMLVTVRDRVAGLKKQGKALSETVAAKPTAEFDAQWGQFIVSGALFTRLVYAGVK